MAPKYLKLTYDSSTKKWSSQEMDGNSPGSIGLADGVTGTMTAVFVPFGFTLAEFLASAKRLTGWRCLKYTALAALGLSLCIECLQLILRAGIFELTDLVLNTAGAALGAALPLACRALFCRSKASPVSRESFLTCRKKS